MQVDSAKAFCRPTGAVSEILPGRLFAGELPGASRSLFRVSWSQLRLLGVDLVVSLVDEAEKPPAGIRWLRAPIEDHDELERAGISTAWLDQVVNNLEAQLARGSVVYLHCLMGVSRTALVLVALLMRRRGLSASDALEALRQHRPCLAPNEGFLRLLESWNQARQRRTVVIGDVQGRQETLKACLGRAGLIDRSGRWTGGDARLVQLGNCIDRHGRLPETLDVLARLQREAPLVGGQVVRLAGVQEIALMRGSQGGRDRQWADRLRREVAEGRVIAAVVLSEKLCLHRGLGRSVRHRLAEEARSRKYAAGVAGIAIRMNEVFARAARENSFDHALLDEWAETAPASNSDLLGMADAQGVPRIDADTIVAHSPGELDVEARIDQVVIGSLWGGPTYLELAGEQCRWHTRNGRGSWTHLVEPLDPGAHKYQRQPSIRLTGRTTCSLPARLHPATKQ